MSAKFVMFFSLLFPSLLVLLAIGVGVPKWLSIAMLLNVFGTYIVSADWENLKRRNTYMKEYIKTLTK